VPENYFTNYLSLGQVIDHYHNTLTEDEAKKFTVDKAVVTVRDCLAHGRLYTPHQEFPRYNLEVRKGETRQSAGVQHHTHQGVVDHDIQQHRWAAPQSVRML
jgi:hypothetical protein